MDVITFPINLQTTSGLSILLHGVMSLSYSCTSLHMTSRRSFLTLCIQMSFHIDIDTKSMGLAIVYLNGLQAEVCKLLNISGPEGCFNLSIMLHFILVFTVCEKKTVRGFQYAKC